MVLGTSSCHTERLGECRATFLSLNVTSSLLYTSVDNMKCRKCKTKDMDMESRHVRDKNSGPGATFAEGFCKQVGDLKTP